MSIVLNSPLPWLRQAEAVGHLCEYMSNYTGRFFESFAACSDPGRFEATDIVAVSCLAIAVPPAASAWLLLGDGQRQTAQLLPSIGRSPKAKLVDDDLATNVAALKLWQLLRKQRDVGPTTVSKLMAAKRPHLVPIYDSYVAAALLPEGVGANWEWWGPWQALLRGPVGSEISSALQSIRRGAAEQGVRTEQLSDLRIIDIVIWRAEEQRRRERLG